MASRNESVKGAAAVYLCTLLQGALILGNPYSPVRGEGPAKRTTAENLVSGPRWELQKNTPLKPFFFDHQDQDTLRTTTLATQFPRRHLLGSWVNRRFGDTPRRPLADRPETTSHAFGRILRPQYQNPLGERGQADGVSFRNGSASSEAKKSKNPSGSGPALISARWS